MVSGCTGLSHRDQQGFLLKGLLFYSFDAFVVMGLQVCFTGWMRTGVVRLDAVGRSLIMGALRMNVTSTLSRLGRV